MRIEYKILWVEDDQSWYDTTKELFTETLDDLGFKLISKRCESIEEVKTEVKDNNLEEYDLLLVDFTLKNSDTGDIIIDFLRKIKDEPILTDVLFYSSAVENVRDSMSKLGLEGVYTADRKEIESKFEQVVNTTIKKVQEVNNMRGLIMAETSDLDELMYEIIEIMLDSDISKKLTTYIQKEIEATLNKISKITLNKETALIEKMSDSRVFTSFHRAKGINQIYKLKKIGIDKFFEVYNRDIISTRNLFAHVKESYEGSQKVLISSATGKKEVFDEKRCINIRQSLIKYREVLEKIKDTVAKQ
jgi:hypothetical protein